MGFEEDETFDNWVKDDDPYDDSYGVNEIEEDLQGPERYAQDICMGLDAARQASEELETLDGFAGHPALRKLKRGLDLAENGAEELFG